MARVSSFDVTLDTCVLLPITLCDTLLRFAEAEFYRPHWSRETLEELDRTLQEVMGLSRGAAHRRIGLMTDSFPEALVTGDARLIDAMPTHPKDRHVAAAAVRSHSQVIVTANLKHFPAQALAEFDVEPQHPDDFLLFQSDLDPIAAVGILVRQAEDRSRPPQSVVDILDRLARSVPKTADALRALLGLETSGQLAVPSTLSTLRSEMEAARQRAPGR